MEVHNRDMFPTCQTKKLYEVLLPIVANDIVDKHFKAYDKAAASAKRRYHRLGRIGIILVILSAIFTIAEALVIPEVSWIPKVSVFFVFIGGVGVLVQLYLLVTRKKQEWLLSRFAAERLRSIKFQAYALSFEAVSPNDLSEKANDFFAAEIARLEGELNAGGAALLLFSPAQMTAPRSQVGAPKAPTIEAAARQAYRELRIKYQRQFATGEIASITSKQRLEGTTSDILYLLGAGLVVAALICKLLFPQASAVSAWIDFTAVSAFVLSLSNAILENASLAETSKVRYEDYVSALSDCDNELTAENAPFPEVVRRIERVVLEELNQFCKSAARISYRL